MIFSVCYRRFARRSQFPHQPLRMDTSYTFPFRHIHSRSASTLAAQDIVKSYHNAAADTSAPVMCLTPTQRNYLASAIRVNQAGELAARLIYIAQAPPIQRSQPELRTLMRHMYDQEQGHFDAFNGLIAEHKVRPTAMYSIWEYAASFLGWSTAVMGREVAMACTEAVETEIGGHYNQQISTVFEWFADARERGERPNAELVQLVQDLRRIRDEELEHLDLSVEQEAKEAKPYEPLVGVIRLGCRAAIKISERL